MMFVSVFLGQIKITNFSDLTEEYKIMKSFNWKKLVGLGLSVFTLFIGSVTLTGCEAEQEEDVEELEEETEDSEEE